MSVCCVERHRSEPGVRLGASFPPVPLLFFFAPGTRPLSSPAPAAATQSSAQAPTGLHSSIQSH